MQIMYLVQSRDYWILLWHTALVNFQSLNLPGARKGRTPLGHNPHIDTTCTCELCGGS